VSIGDVAPTRSEGKGHGGSRRAGVEKTAQTKSGDSNR
jgi:hypothetical protein